MNKHTVSSHTPGAGWNDDDWTGLYSDSDDQ